MDDDNKLSMKMQSKAEETRVASDPLVDNVTCPIPSQPSDNGDSESRGVDAENISSEELVSCDQTREILHSLASVKIEDNASDDKGWPLNFFMYISFDLLIKGLFCTSLCKTLILLRLHHDTFMRF